MDRLVSSSACSSRLLMSGVMLSLSAAPSTALDPCGSRLAVEGRLLRSLDETLSALDQELAGASTSAERDRIAKEVRHREQQLLPLYTSVAEEFADLHDRPRRMQAKGAIRQILEWRNARRFFYWRVRRRLFEDERARAVREADPRLTSADSYRARRCVLNSK